MGMELKACAPWLTFTFPEGAMQVPGEEKSSTVLCSCEPLYELQYQPARRVVPIGEIVACLL